LNLLEVYDAGADEARALRNFSIRGWAGRGEQSLVAGFVLSGDESTHVLIRAIGPTLADFGVAAPVADPALRVDGGNGFSDHNDDWFDSPEMATAVAATGAFALPDGSSDA